jgi:hypothetical protein
VVELKSAWQVIDGEEEDPTFITTRALVSRLSQKDGRILEDHNDPIQVTVRLLALHVAFTLPGHPELIWSTFEHARPSDDADFKEDPTGQKPFAHGSQ